MYRPEPRRLRPVSQLHSQSSSCQCHRQRARRVTCKSHGDRAAVKLGEREAIEGLVEVRLLVPQDADRDRFAEQKSLHGIRAPTLTPRVSNFAFAGRAAEICARADEDM